MTGSTTLTRRVQFAAAHRYRRPASDDARNAAVFGLRAGPEDATLSATVEPA